ncbi:PepSY-associated TM helix domain-containing protein [Methylomonas sp. AM2-LC]|uniref:PepSY-associated TM helix domain-containing protein n=1 Tax=Methylomonas sp. AM2-LC TaxID=3153301 RepID=UPI003265E645
MKIRHFWVVVHRIAGLAMTGFLIIVGLTGSILVFNNELEGLINPARHTISKDREPLDASILIEIAEKVSADGEISAILFDASAINILFEPKQSIDSEVATPLVYNRIILNPYTGEILDRSQISDVFKGLSDLIPFIYRVHYSLAMGKIGGWILGITALVWTVDCFIGFYLTLPLARITCPPSNPLLNKSFVNRWRLAWCIKWPTSPIRFNFDLHRAGGLWVWVALLVFAWSSVYMNLEGFYTRVMQSISSYHQPWTEYPDLPQPVLNAGIGWRPAQENAQVALNQLYREQGIRVNAPVSFWINREKGFYLYSVHTNADIQDHGGQTRVVIDANNGDVKQIFLPTGQYNGNTITSWLIALHMANVWGLPYRIFVCIFGSGIVMLSVTGVFIWLKKRKSKCVKPRISA